MLLVVKMGGSILKEGASSDLISDLKEVLKENKAIIVHGGGVENSSFRRRVSEAATPIRKL
jgi:acetylglutamate kinase